MSDNTCLILIFVVLLLAVFGAFLLFEADAEPEITAEDVTADGAERLSVLTVYDIPLYDGIQLYTQMICEQYGVNYKIVLSIMYVESGFDTNAVNGDCIGLMQVNTVNLPELKAIGVTDLYDPYQNIKAGVYLLKKALGKYDISAALIEYNCGPTGAKELLDSGTYSTEYTRKVIKYAAGLKVKERIYEEVQS